MEYKRVNIEDEWINVPEKINEFVDLHLNNIVTISRLMGYSTIVSYNSSYLRIYMEDSRNSFIQMRLRCIGEKRELYSIEFFTPWEAQSSGSDIDVSLIECVLELL